MTTRSELAMSTAHEIASHIGKLTSLEVRSNDTVALLQVWCVNEVADIVQKSIDAALSTHQQLAFDVTVSCKTCGRVVSRLGGSPVTVIHCACPTNAAERQR